MDPTDRHLDPLTLDALRAGEPLAAAAVAHAAWCAACRAQVAQLTALAAALRRPPAVASIPPAREQAMLALAARHAARVRRARRRPWLAAAAVAASALLAVSVTLTLRAGAPPPATTAPVTAAALSRASADLDGDGRVTVLDAFALARAAQHGTPALGDVASERVEEILAMAVALEPR